MNWERNMYMSRGLESSHELILGTVANKHQRVSLGDVDSTAMAYLL